MPVRITGMIRFHFWLLTIALLLPTPAMAWGKTGHRLIARLAEAQLTPQAQRQVQALLAGEDATDLWPDVVAEAFERMARKGDRSLISKVFRVLLAEGHKPAATLKDGSLTVTYSPEQGLAGRPSSKRIIKVMNR